MIRIRVPATSANIGPGFDCMGIAFKLYNTFEFAGLEQGLVIEGCASEYQNKNNLVYRAMQHCFDEIGAGFGGVKISLKSYIPISRGLGSSAACILGGVMGANMLAGNKLSLEDILRIAADIEGHPDNAAPALYGGMTAAVAEAGRVYVEKLKVSEALCFCALIPDFPLSTEKSRSVIPGEISHKDAVFNIGRTAFMISGLGSGNADSIRLGCQDRLHQSYRGPLIRGYEDIVRSCEELGALGTFLSGAGPSIMTVLHRTQEDFAGLLQKRMAVLEDRWEIKLLEVDTLGAQAEIIEEAYCL